MANLLHRLQELSIAAKSTMIVDQVLVLMDRGVDEDLKFKEKFRELCLEISDSVKDMAEVIEELESFPRLRDNLQATEIACVCGSVCNREICRSLPLVVKRLGVNDCKSMLEKVESKMPSYAGRIQLSIKSMLDF
ncbi:hypothetical protein Tco_0790265 [Tanacetum coccineum]